MARLFFSYSHHDEGIRNELEVHLSMLKKQGVIEPWHDRRIDAGSELDTSIDSNLENSDIILLLVSPHFLDSDYCYEKEVSKALEMQKNGRAKVIPIILEHCDWQDTLLGKLLALPQDGKPISMYPNINKALNEITNEIRKVAEGINQSKSKKSINTKLLKDQENPAFVKEVIRSSNLRVKRDFSDHDKDQFTQDAFEYICKYFENSLKELENRIRNIKYSFRKVDANSFTATIYYNGKKRSCCTIRHQSKEYYSGGITYSTGSWNEQGVNEILTVDDDGYILYLSAMMGFGLAGGKDVKMNYEGASEHFWSQFITPLQG